MYQRTTVHGERQRLEALIKRCTELDQLDELASDVAQHLCVRVCGFVEMFIKLTLSEHVKGQASPSCTSFIIAQVDRHLPSPKPNNICTFVGGFDATKEQQLRASFDDNDEAKSALGSLVANRHLVAHGRSSDVTVRRVIDWYEAMTPVLESLRNLFPAPVPCR